MKYQDIEYGTTSFPRQKVSYTVKKTEKWQKESVDGVINICNSYGRTRRSDARVKMRNYNLLNNKIDKSDFEYVLNPFNLSKDLLNNFQFPASLQPYDVVSPYFKLLMGEEAKRPFEPIVAAVNEESISQKMAMKQQEVVKSLMDMLVGQLQQVEGEEPQTPKEVIELAQMSFRDTKEKIAQNVLNYYMKFLDLPNTFQEGWKDALVAAEEIYRIDDVAGHPKVTRVNPLEISFLIGPNSYMLDTAEKIYERNSMSVSEIIDEFYEELTEAEIRELESWDVDSGALSYHSTGPDVNTYFSPSTIPYVNSIYDVEGTADYGYDVHRVRWRSYRKMGILHYLDPETQEEYQELVDEFFKVPIDKDDPTMWIEWFWVTEYWQGVRIGNETNGIYLDIRERTQQFRNIDNLSECKSGYVGTLYDSTNSQAVSLMDRLFPWVSLYMIMWYRTELLVASDMGKVSTIDLSLVPDGWEMEKWLYYLNAFKIGFVNSFNEGQRGERTGRQNQSQQNKTLDLGNNQAIRGNIELLMYIEQKIKDTAGITDQRLGAISASELVGNTERSVVQSSHITEEYFRVHNHTKVRVCEALLAVAKDAMKYDTRYYQLFTDDLQTHMFKVEPEEISLASYGIFVGNSAKDHEALQTFKQLLNAAITNDKLLMSDIVDVINSNSLSTLKARLKVSEQARMEQMQKAQQEANALQAQKQQFEMEMKERELEMDQYKIDQDNRTRLEVAAMQTYMGQQQLDLDNNGIPDPAELLQAALKRQELESKENIERLKIRQTEVQNKSQEKIQAEQTRIKREEMKSKEKIERMKAKAKPKSSK